MLQQIRKACTISRASEAQRPKGLGFPVRYFPYGCIVPLDPALKGGVKGHLPAGWISSPALEG